MRERHSLAPREAAAYVQLRRMGYTFKTIAQAFGRSYSVIYRRIQFNRRVKNLWDKDLRKLPAAMKRRNRDFQWRRIQKWLLAWQMFALSEEGEPP